MEPITAGILVVLGKYALDKGVELGKEVGPKALETAKEMFALALEKLRSRPNGEVIAQNFEQDPETWQKPAEKELDQAMAEDKEFKEALEAMVKQFDEEAKAHAESTGANYTSISVLGERNVTVGGSVSGSTIITGDNPTPTRGE